MTQNTNESIINFPIHGILPKDEIEISSFLKKYPTFDGRGITVAIFDTGVDPGCEGLQITSEGKPKIVDLVDATGAGDVDTSTIVEAKEGVIKSPFTGKEIKIGNWNNPSNQYHIGMKRAYELFPKELITRLTSERKKNFDKQQGEAISKLNIEIQKAKEKNDSKRVQDLELQLEQLKEFASKYEDAGSIIECIVFHDGNVWRAAIDTKGDGDLTNAKLLTDYSIEKQYDTFSELDLLNYSLNIYEEGNILSIVTCAGSHGTHVAGIVGAYYPTSPELNGIAPGCQIVSVKIGDTRLGTMETGTGMCRGVYACHRNKCDIANMSYGEPTQTPNKGRVISMISDLVNKHGVLFIASGGNSGPALSTNGAPGATTSAVMGIGAYVSPNMMQTGYSLRETLPETQFTWSSRGPSTDGTLGISVSAPGGAIATMPTYTLKKHELKNGTSMSSPSVAGAIAVLLSALKENGKKWNPYIIRRALENTARKVEGVEDLALGNGLVQIEKAYQYLEKFPYSEEKNYRITIQCHKGRGIYLRGYEETNRILEETIYVETKFQEETPNHIKVKFDKRVKLSATKPWIQTPEYFILYNGSRNFSVKVDPTQVEEGTYEFGEIIAMDCEEPNAGPLFKVPVTVCRPKKPTGFIMEYKDLQFKAGTISRNFIHVPHGATFAELTISAKNVDTQRLFLVHTVQLMPKQTFRANEFKKYIRLSNHETSINRFKVKEGVTLELCIAQFWSALGDSTLDVKIEFHGIITDSILLNGNERIQRINLSAPLRTETLKISAHLTSLKKSILPVNHSIRTLNDPRNTTLDGKAVHEMILTYNAKLSEPCTVTVKVPVLHTILYENEFESQMWMVFNAHKELIKVGDYEPDKIKLKKGDYTIRVQIRHDELPLLQKLKALPLILEFEFKKVAIDIYGNINDAFLQTGKKIKEVKFRKGGLWSIFAALPPLDKLPKMASAGDVLEGRMNLFPELKGFKNMGSVPISFIMPPQEQKKSSNDNDIKKQLEELDKRSPTEKLNEYLLEEKVKYLSKIKNKEEFETLLKLLLDENPKHLPLLELKLKRKLDEKEKDLEKIIELCDLIISLIDTNSLAIHFGTRSKDQPEDPLKIKERKEMDKKKEFLVFALTKKLESLISIGEKSKDAVKSTFEELQKWVDTKDAKYLYLDVQYQKYNGKLGSALQSLNKQLANSVGDPVEKQLYEQQMQLVKELGWNHIYDYLQEWKIIKFPQKYPPF